MQWGMNKNVTPYQIDLNINGVWRNFATVTPTGSFSIPSVAFYDAAKKNVSMGLSPYVPSAGGANDQYNLAIGPDTLASSPNTNQNIAIGWYNMHDLTGSSGGQNVAVGTYVLPYATTTQFATGLGTAVLRNITTGGFGSTAIGHGAAAGDDTTTDVGGKNTTPATGQQNTNIGAWSGQEQTSASGNSCLGANSCVENAEVGFNTALGFSALAGSLQAINDLLYANSVAYSVAVGSQAALKTSGGGQTIYAHGFIRMLTNPTPGSTITLGTTTVTFVSSGAAGNQVNIGANVFATLANLATMTNASSDPQISQARYWVKNAYDFAVQYKVAGVSGNTFALATTVTGATVYGSGGYLDRAVPVAYPIVAVGYQSMRNNLDSQENTAVGYASLYASEASIGNSAFGFLSLYNLTTGNSNTAIGDKAAALATTGDSNTNLGYRAGYNNVTGSFTTFIGSQAGDTNKIGGNTGVGAQALYANDGSTGGASGNTCVGYQCIRDNVSGTGNTAIGQAAGAGNTTANYNTSIGFLAHNTATGFSNVIALGYNAQPTASNQTVLGNASTTDTVFYGSIHFLQGFTSGSIPACNVANTGRLFLVNDALAPSYLGVYSGGGAVKTLVLCDGTNWTFH
jgi:hypothetical protein